MILVYLPNKQIHQYFLGFGAVTTVNGTLHIDGRDTTTCAADVLWKYIADQRLETDENGAYLHDADYYEALEPLPTADSRIAAIEMYLLEQELGL
jgi:hypothetical protein